MVSKLGILSLFIGFFVGVFSIISKFMKADNIWVDITLSSLSESAAERAVDAFSSEMVSDALYILFYELPLGGVFLGLGVLLLIISLFVKDH